jgi:hypothetical protein
MVLNHTGFKEQQSLMDRSPYDEITPKQEPSSHGNFFIISSSNTKFFGSLCRA